MSLLNLYLNRDHALLCVDTAVGTSDGSRYEMTKLMPLTHAGCVFGTCGLVGLLTGVYQQANIGGARDFDSIAASMLSWLNAAFKWMEADLHKDGVPEHLIYGEHQIVVVGWSVSEHQMAALVCSFQTEARIFKIQRTTWLAIPNPQDGADVPAPTNREDLAMLASRQIRWVRANWGEAELAALGPEPVIGKSLLWAYVDKDQITLRRDKVPA